MTDQWQELKETIIELRDNDGTGTQQEVCKFLANYMDILEKQMQSPCKNTIDRQAVLDMMQMRMSGKELYKAVYDLPPVNPQPCGDLISRKAILEEFENDQYHLEFCKEHHIERSISMEMVRIRLHDLPSVNPQPCEDAISRQAVKELYYKDGYIDFRKICELPPVNPQAKTGKWIKSRDSYGNNHFTCPFLRE